MRTVLVGLLAAVLGGVAPDASARFLSVDPVQANQRPGQNFNRYWYANNNPYKFTDPDGRDATWITHKDGTSTLVIKVLMTGEGATAPLASEIESSVESLSFPRSDVKIDVQMVGSRGRGVNQLNLSPGNGGCPDAGCVNRLGGNRGHVNSEIQDLVKVATHEVLHFAGIDDAYIEGPRDANGNRTTAPKPGFDRTNVMAGRSGRTLKDSQLDEAKANRTTKKVTEK